MESITGWRTSTRTQGQGQCVEVGFGDERVGVRDTKNRAGGHLAVPVHRWREFVEEIKHGELEA